MILAAIERININMKTSVINEIKKEYDRKRLKALSELDERKNEIYELLPRLKEIDKQITIIGVKISKLFITKSDDYKSMFDSLVMEQKKLKKEKDNIFKNNRIPSNFLEPVYECNMCNDTGYLESNEKCVCFKQQIIENLYEMSNINYMLEKENFDTFNINVFNDDTYKDEPLTPRQNMRRILSMCENFFSDFDKNNSNLLFYGNTGLGKTFMCNCLAKALIDTGKTVVYQTAFKLLEIVEEHKFNKQNEDALNRESYNLIFNSDLLIIDDLGTEFINSFTNSELFNIINSRLISGKNTVISTNLSMDELANAYSDRIISRIFNRYISCKFYGNDLRWENS